MRDVPAPDAPSSAPAAGTILVIVDGVVDARRARTVHCSVIDALRRHQPARIHLDLSGCTRIETAAVHGLWLCQTDAAQLDCRLVLTRAPTPVRPVLRAAGLLD